MVKNSTISKQAWAVRDLIQVLKQSIKADKDAPPRLKRCPKDGQSKNILKNMFAHLENPILNQWKGNGFLDTA